MGRPRPPSPEADEAEARRREWAEDEATKEAAATEVSPPAPPRTAEEVFLVVRLAEGVSVTALPDPGVCLVGRAEDTDVRIDEGEVSRHHAKVSLRGGAMTLEDLGSRNGTFVNGRKVSRDTVPLRAGDVIVVGGGELVVAARSDRHAAPASMELAGDVAVGDPKTKAAYDHARKVAPMGTTVLILGETGAGKDVMAQWIHANGPRKDRPFVRVNCGAIPEALLESELFGHERGAFTGADRRKIGYFEAAHGGTIFLDEIGELSAAAQVKLLSVLENRMVTRVGATAPTPIDVRVLCATHRDLRALVAEGRFRADLFYRIGTFVVHMPPLRERPLGVEALANAFLRRFAEPLGMPVPGIAPKTLERLRGHTWPGNVRELRNVMERAFVLAEGGTLHPHHVALDDAPAGEASGRSLDRIRMDRDDAERRLIEEAIAAEGGNQTRAAARIGMPRRTLVHKLTTYRRGDRGDSGEPEG